MSKWPSCEELESLCVLEKPLIPRDLWSFQRAKASRRIKKRTKTIASAAKDSKILLFWNHLPLIPCDVSQNPPRNLKELQFWVSESIHFTFQNLRSINPWLTYSMRDVFHADRIKHPSSALCCIPWFSPNGQVHGRKSTLLFWHATSKSFVRIIKKIKT